ncbi:MAG TPA: YceH family protein [Thermodesulfovibrionales bacterium]|nr:YceH family protein [Thermodesulfovibrionales bacterium]
MDIVLDDIEVRILGCLIEKEMTTPEYYPLSLNALINACNQKSNRRPVLFLGESDVLKGLGSLRQKGLSQETHVPGSRVTKYLHGLLSRFDLAAPEIAVLCDLMLRGPQTAGELRMNSGRMATVGSAEEMEETLRGLIEHDPPLVTKLLREAGKREPRYAHLLSGKIIQEKIPPELPAATPASGEQTSEAITRLENEIAEIRKELEQLRQAFAEFKSQF